VRDHAAAMTPETALARMKAGNERFVEGRMVPRDHLEQVRVAAAEPRPHSVVLGCIDSRVPPELVFDQGVGDLFIGRVAGNFVNDDLLGSLELATKLAGARLVLVLGHSECSAIKGACDGVKLGLLTGTLANLTPAVELVTCDGPRSSSNAGFVQAVAEANVRLMVEAIPKRSAVIRALVESGDARVVGAMHDVATGRVRFFE